MKLLLLTFLITFHFAGAEPVQNTIELKESMTAEPHSTLNLLSLVDEQKSGEFTDIREKLSSREVVVLQEAGEQMELSSQSIVQHLKSALNSKERELYKFSIPRRIQISVKQPALTAEEVTRRLTTEWQKYCMDCRVEVREVRLPLGTFKKWELSIPKKIPHGSFNIPLIVNGADGVDATYWIQGKVDILKEVPVAQRALYQGERVQSTDFKYQWQSVTHAVDGAPEKNLLVGMKVKIPVSANQIIWSRSLEKEKALNKGDHVRVSFKEGSWELSLSAVAEKDGEIGDTITLKNPSTNRNLMGLVVGKGEVEIQ